MRDILCIKHYHYAFCLMLTQQFQFIADSGIQYIADSAI